MNITEGKTFEIGKKYKIMYKKGCKRAYSYDAECIKIGGFSDNRCLKAVFEVDGRKINYLITRDTMMLERNDEICVIKQDVAIYEKARYNPRAIQYIRYGVIYAENEICTM